jgi:hypothetical protein
MLETRKLRGSAWTGANALSYPRYFQRERIFTTQEKNPTKLPAVRAPRPYFRISPTTRSGLARCNTFDKFSPQ